MSALWVSVCLAAAAVAAGLAAVCALAALRIPGHVAAAAPSMVVMAASTLDMALPNGQVLSPLAWAALLVGATLLTLLDRRRRVAAAHHAAGLLLMAVMWCAMLPGLPGVDPAGAAGAPQLSSYSGSSASLSPLASNRPTTGISASGLSASGLSASGTSETAVPASRAPAEPAVPSVVVTAAGHAGHGAAWTGYGMLLGWVVVAASVALAASAVRTATRRTGWQGTSIAERLEAAQHVSMALAMAAMTAGMFLPVSWQ